MVKKILAGIGVIVLLLLLLLALAPFVFKSKINAKIKEEFAEQLNAKADYSNFSVSFIHSFPNFSFTIDNLSVTGMGEFNGDTLAFVKSANFSVDIRSVIKGGAYQILTVNIETPSVNLIVDTNGKVNWNISKPGTGGRSGETKASPFSIDLKKFNIENAEVDYSDKRNGADVQIHNLSFDGTGNITTSYYDVTIKSKPVELSYQRGPTSGERLWSLLHLSAHIKTRKSDIVNGNFEAITASGDVSVIKLQYNNGESSNPIVLSPSQLFFTEKVISLDSVNAVIANNSLTVKGKLDNYMPYLLSRGDLNGVLDVSASIFDANEIIKKNTVQLTAKTSSPANSSVKSLKTYIKVPAHINVKFIPLLGKVLYDKVAAENVKGLLTIKDEELYGNLSGHIFGGNADIAGNYVTKNTEHPGFDVSYDVRNMDIHRAYNSIKAMREIIPGLQYVTGSFNSTLRCAGKLKPDMSIDYNSMDGSGSLAMPDAKITELPMLSKVGKVAKIPSLENLEFKNAAVNFYVHWGRVDMDQAVLNFTNGYSMLLQGATWFNKTINYDIVLSIPAKETISSSIVARNILAKIPGISDYLPEKVGFAFKVTGTIDKPDLKFLKMEQGIH